MGINSKKPTCGILSIGLYGYAPVDNDCVDWCVGTYLCRTYANLKTILTKFGKIVSFAKFDLGHTLWIHSAEL